MSLKRASAGGLIAPCIRGTNTIWGIRTGSSGIRGSRTIIYGSVDD